MPSAVLVWQGIVVTCTAAIFFRKVYWTDTDQRIVNSLPNNFKNVRNTGNCVSCSCDYLFLRQSFQ